MGTLRIYNASAGSGKTYSLVREYLALLLSSSRADAYRQILAVTFTNKAAWEMKRRILSVLESLSAGRNDTGMEEYLFRKTGLPPSVLQKRAGEILENLFNDYSAFSVSTIDSFTTRLVRSFSHELNLPVGFNIVVDADDILRQAVDMLLMRAGQDESLSDMLLDFVLRNVDQGNSWDISSVLFSGGKMTLREGNAEELERLGDKKIADYLALQRRLTAYKTAVEKQISVLGERACRIVYDEIGSDKVLSGGGNGVASFFRKARHGRVLDLDAGAASVQKFLAGQYASSTATAEQKIAVGNRYQELCALAEEIADVLEKKREAYAYADLVLVPLGKMSVVGQIESHVREIKQRSGVMLLHEFNDIISRHLRHEPVPFIYEKIGERYKHYFIDEFQDTSRLQWTNLRELVYNQLAQDGQAVIVGDAKQAIYRWRGGDTEQFVGLYENGGGLPPEQYEVDNLDTNYRSGRHIVEFTNEFFTVTAPLAGNDSFQKVYEEGNRQKAASSAAGFVSIRDIPGKTSGERLEPTLQAVADEIRQVVSDDGYDYGNIAVLYRSNSEGAALAEYLSGEGIPLVSSESLLIASSAAVRFAAAVMRFIAYPDDTQARASILGFLQAENRLPAGDADEIKAVYVSARASDFYRLLSSACGERFSRHPAESLPLYECAEYIAGSFDLWGKGQDAYLLAFLDMIVDFIRDNTASAAAFLAHWDERKTSASIAASDVGGAVELMTIHKSKGLEFPVVIVPFACWRISDKEEIWTELPQNEVLDGLPVAYVPLSSVKKYGLEEVYAPYQARIMLDNLNLMYVALTRAREQLHVITSLDAPGRTVAEFFTLFMGNTDVRNEDDPQGIYLYSAGERIRKQGRKEGRQATFSIGQVESSPWRERLRVSLDWKKVWATAPDSAVERGNILHETLAAVRDASQVDAAVSRGLMTGLFPSDDMMDIRRQVRAVVEHPALREYYGQPWQGETERELMTAEGRVLRPDRICICGNRAVVIDYKTGAPRTEHADQVAAYAHLLEKMGYRVEKCLLVYLCGDGIEVRES